MKYRFCEELQKSIFWGDYYVAHCCVCTSDVMTTFISPYAGEHIDWEWVISEKQRFQREAKEGKTPFPMCENCLRFEEREWDDGGFINSMTISHWTNCNCNCFYCYTAEDKKLFNTQKAYAILPVIKEMDEAGILKYDGIIRFLGGDVARLEDINECLEFFLEHGAKNLAIYTSGIEYMPILSKVLEKGAGEVIISPDSGNAKLYKKIKRIDCYNQVIENMQKYASAAKKGNSVIRSKYIVLPYVNDKKEYIDEWFADCLKIGIKHIAYDFELNFVSKYKRSIPPHIIELFNYIEEQAKIKEMDLSKYWYGAQLQVDIEKGLYKTAVGQRNTAAQKKFIKNLLKR